MKGVERGKNLSAPRKEVDSILDKPLFGDSGAESKEQRSQLTKQAILMYSWL